MSPTYRLSEEGILLSSLEGKPEPEPIAAHSSSDKMWRGPKSPGKKSSAPGAACPVCGIRVKASKLARHMLKIHGREGAKLVDQTSQSETPSPSLQLASDPRPVSAPGQTMVHCSICHSVVPSDEWADHKREIHSSDMPSVAARSSSDRPSPETQRPNASGKPAGKRSSPKEPPTAESQENAVPSKPVAKCSVCCAWVRADRLERHMQRAHQSEGSSVVVPSATERSKANAQQRSNSKKIYAARCPDCGILVRRDGLVQHVREAHSSANPPAISQLAAELQNAAVQQTEQPGKTMVECHICGVLVGANRLRKHMRKVHPSVKLSAMPATAVGSPNAQSSRSGERDKGVAGPSGRQDHLEQALRQSDHESIDGSKYVGFMRREWDGKFGSFPLHDGFDDESGAN